MRDSYIIQYIIIFLIVIGIVVFKVLQSRYRKKKGIKSSPCSCCSSKCSCAKVMPKEPVKPCCCCQQPAEKETVTDKNESKETK